MTIKEIIQKEQDYTNKFTQNSPTEIITPERHKQIMKKIIKYCKKNGYNKWNEENKNA